MGSIWLSDWSPHTFPSLDPGRPLCICFCSDAIVRFHHGFPAQTGKGLTLERGEVQQRSLGSSRSRSHTGLAFSTGNRPWKFAVTELFRGNLDRHCSPPGAFTTPSPARPPARPPAIQPPAPPAAHVRAPAPARVPLRTSRLAVQLGPTAVSSSVWVQLQSSRLLATRRVTPLGWHECEFFF